jgi:hypothetical protein
VSVEMLGFQEYTVMLCPLSFLFENDKYTSVGRLLARHALKKKKKKKKKSLVLDTQAFPG